MADNPNTLPEIRPQGQMQPVGHLVPIGLLTDAILAETLRRMQERAR